MSRILFLDNAYLGKNNWWRYLLTIILSLVVSSLIAGFFILLLLGFYFVLETGSIVGINRLIEEMITSSLFLLSLVAVSFSITFVIFYICIRFIHKKKFLSLINTKSKINWARILKGAGIWLLIITCLDLISFLMFPASYKVTFDPNNFGTLLVICLIAFPVQASFEEVFFRGYLMQGIGLLSKKPIIPLLVTSFIFGLAHFLNGNTEVMGIVIVLETLIIGIMLGTITLGENGIDTAVGIHVANNMYVGVVNNTPDSGLGNLPSIFTSQPADPYISLFVMVIASSIMIAIVFWKKKDDLIGIFRG